MHVSGEDKSGMICRCPKHPGAATWQTHMHSPDFVPVLSSTAASVTRKCGSLPSHGAQKNVLWDLRDDASQLLRRHAAAGARFVDRTVSLPARHRGSSGSVPSVWSYGRARRMSTKYSTPSTRTMGRTH